MKTPQKILQHIAGLDEKEAAIYVALLELGEGSVAEIAQKAGLKRTTVYNLVPDLIETSLIQTLLKKGKRKYFVEDVRTLETNLKEKETRLAQVLPELQAMHNIFPFKPKITYFEGASGLKEMYLDTLRSCQPGDEILSIMGMHDIYKYFDRDFANTYIKERAKKKIRLRMISSRSEEAIETIKINKEALRETKFIDNYPSQFQSDMEIYGNKVALISFSENQMGVIIESKQIHEMHRSTFEILWRALPVQK